MKNNNKQQQRENLCERSSVENKKRKIPKYTFDQFLVQCDQNRTSVGDLWEGPKPVDREIRNADYIAHMVGESRQIGSVSIQGETIEELRANLLRDIWGIIEVGYAVEQSKKMCREQLSEQAVASFADYQNSGKHLTGKEVIDFLRSGKTGELPECHR
ncbi:hypothetical protein [Pectobacterium brasiliense]|uniref:hypothetical protein n=2 Tax=Pectobacterium TaxID=122277 RepID=UPI0019696E4A|nr:hypothetical protein [Pectobacterium brasiliense]